MPKKFCGFCKVFCSKKIAEIRKIFQKNIFSSKNLSKNFGFFIDFSLFHLSKSANFCHLHQFFTATFPISHPNTTPQLFANLSPKYHNFSPKHQSTTHHLITQIPHPPHMPILLSFQPCLLFHLCFPFPHASTARVSINKTPAARMRMLVHVYVCMYSVRACVVRACVCRAYACICVRAFQYYIVTLLSHLILTSMMLCI